MPDLMIERIVPWQLNGQKQSAFLCTPEHLDELAAGYLYTQGMIAGLGDIAEIAGDENGLNVTLREGVAPRRTDILERLQACPACKSDFQAPLVPPAAERKKLFRHAPAGAALRRSGGIPRGRRPPQRRR